MEPTAYINGLAVYKIGSGEPIFIMPYPHASTSISIAEDSITKTILRTGRTVITFDPPGSYNSSRLAKVDMQEMIDCANETMNYFNIQDKIDLIGHSMGGFCALAYTIENPNKVKRLVLIGSTSGWKAVRKWGVHKTWKWWRDKEFWQSRYWGTKIILGFNNLKIQKKLDNIVEQASFVDKKYVHLLTINKDDNQKPLPIRGKWLDNVRKYDYKNRLSTINVPVLICVGKFDPQTPLIMNKELSDGIKNSQLTIFNNSGHSPFIEENKYFIEVLIDFYNKPDGYFKN